MYRMQIAMPINLYGFLMSRLSKKRVDLRKTTKGNDESRTSLPYPLILFVKKIRLNPYVSITCIRFEGIISARHRAPF